MISKNSCQSPPRQYVPPDQLTVRSTFWSLLAICVLSFLSQSCTHSSPTRSSSTTSYLPAENATSLPKVESQLLKTVERAENLGRGNPLVLSSLYSLASYYRSQGQYEKAEVQYKKALQLKEELNGPDHPDLVAILENYADLLREAQRYTEAENLSTRAAAILAKSPLPSPSTSRPY